MVTNGTANVGTLMTDARTIQYCTFNGLVWDKSALETVHLVAKGLVNLTELFKSQNVTIDALLKLQGAPDTEPKKDAEALGPDVIKMRMEENFANKDAKSKKK